MGAMRRWAGALAIAVALLATGAGVASSETSATSPCSDQDTCVAFFGDVLEETTLPECADAESCAAVFTGAVATVLGCEKLDGCGTEPPVPPCDGAESCEPVVAGALGDLLGCASLAACEEEHGSAEPPCDGVESCEQAFLETFAGVFGCDSVDSCREVYGDGDPPQDPPCADAETCSTVVTGVLDCDSPESCREKYLGDGGGGDRSGDPGPGGPGDNGNVLRPGDGKPEGDPPATDDTGGEDGDDDGRSREAGTDGGAARPAPAGAPPAIAVPAVAASSTPRPRRVGHRVRLRRRCAGRAFVLRVAGRHRRNVSHVTVLLGGRRVARDRRAPFVVRVPRRARGEVLRARIVFRDGYLRLVRLPRRHC